MGGIVESEARRMKQQKLLLELVERKIRLRAEELYQGRSVAHGTALDDWLKAEKEVLARSILAPLYWRSRSKREESDSSTQPSSTEQYAETR